MKSILVVFLLLTFSLPVWAGKWEPNDEQLTYFYKLLHHDVNREKVFTEFKLAVNQGMNINFVDPSDGRTILFWVSNVPYHRWEGDEDQRPILFTEWDRKLLKLLVDNGADLNRVLTDSGSRRQFTALHRAVENYNLELAKEMLALGANYLVSFPENSFNFEQNVLTFTMHGSAYDLEAFEYFFNLGGWMPNTRAFCSAGYYAGMIGTNSSEERARRNINKILETAGYDWKACRDILGLGN